MKTVALRKIARMDDVDCEAAEEADMPRESRVERMARERAELIAKHQVLERIVWMLDNALLAFGFEVSRIGVQYRGSFDIDISRKQPADLDKSSVEYNPLTMNVSVSMPLVAYGDTSDEHVYLSMSNGSSENYRFPQQAAEFRDMLVADVAEVLDAQKMRVFMHQQAVALSDRLSTGPSWVKLDEDRISNYGESDIFSHVSRRFSVLPRQGVIYFAANGGDATIIEEILDVIEAKDWSKS